MFSTEATLNMVTGEIVAPSQPRIVKESTYQQISETVGQDILDDILSIDREKLNQLFIAELSEDLRKYGLNPEGVFDYFYIHLPHPKGHTCDCYANQEIGGLVWDITGSIYSLQKHPDVLNLILSCVSDIPYRLRNVYDYRVYPLNSAEDIFNLVSRDIRYRRLNVQTSGTMLMNYYFPSFVRREHIAQARTMLSNHYRLPIKSDAPLTQKGDQLGFHFHL